MISLIALLLIGSLSLATLFALTPDNTRLPVPYHGMSSTPGVKNLAPSDTPRYSPNYQPIWSGYDAQCKLIQVSGTPLCNNTGAQMSFTVPTVSSSAMPSPANGAGCCMLAEWAGIGDAQGAADGLLVQAGITKLTNYWVTNFNTNGSPKSTAVWFQIWLQGSSLNSNPNYSQNDISWPCSTGIQDGDTMNVLVNETAVTSTTSTFHFQWDDTTHLCDLQMDQTISSSVSTFGRGYFILESPPRGSCPYSVPVVPNNQILNICQVPAFEPTVTETGNLVVPTYLTVPITGMPVTQDELNHCETGSFTAVGYNNIYAGSLSYNQWSSVWVSSSQAGVTNNSCSPSFSFDPSPDVVSLSTGNTSESLVVNSVFGYAGTISFTTSVSPSSGLTVTCPSITLAANQAPVYDTCTFNLTSRGSYTVTVSGTSNGVTFAYLWYVNPDFSIGASSPSPTTILTGSSSSSTVTISSLGGYPFPLTPTTVTLSWTSSPGLSCSFGSASIVIASPVSTGAGYSGGYTSNNSGTSTITCSSGVAGDFTVTVTGNDGTISHSATFVLHVLDAFSITANPSSISLPINSAFYQAVSVTVTSLNGFGGTIQLSATSSSTLLLAYFSPSSSVTVSAGSSSQATLMISAGCGMNSGAYSVTVSGTGSSETRSITIPVTLTTSSGSCGSGGGSLAPGTLITMADGQQVSVQNIQVGDKLLGYDPVTCAYGTSVVTSVKIVHTSTLLVIHTASGKALRTDSSVTEILWTKLPSGLTLWLPVTQLNPGDSLLTQQGWTMVTSIDSITNGSFTMYDITATMPYYANGYLDPPHPS